MNPRIVFLFFLIVSPSGSLCMKKMVESFIEKIQKKKEKKAFKNLVVAVRNGDDKTILKILEKNKKLKLSKEVMKFFDGLNSFYSCHSSSFFSKCQDETYYALMAHFDKSILNSNGCFRLLIRSKRKKLIYYYLDNYIPLVDRDIKNDPSFLCKTAFGFLGYKRNVDAFGALVLKKLIKNDFLVGSSDADEWFLWIDLLADYEKFGSLLRIIRKKTDCFDQMLINFVFDSCDDKQKRKKQERAAEFLPNKSYFKAIQNIVVNNFPKLTFSYKEPMLKFPENGGYISHYFFEKKTNFKEYFYKTFLSKGETLFYKGDLFNSKRVYDDNQKRKKDVLSLVQQVHEQVNNSCCRQRFVSLSDAVIKIEP